METMTFTVKLNVDAEDWRVFAQSEPTTQEVSAWVVEVLSISQGVASGAITVQAVR